MAAIKANLLQIFQQIKHVWGARNTPNYSQNADCGTFQRVSLSLEELPVAAEFGLNSLSVMQHTAHTHTPCSILSGRAHEGSFERELAACVILHVTPHKASGKSI
jgi:hypothetical protein